MSMKGITAALDAGAGPAVRTLCGRTPRDELVHTDVVSSHRNSAPGFDDPSLIW